jgi:PAS domain S-box-containing protein
MSLRLATVLSALSVACALLLSALAPMQFAILASAAAVLGSGLLLQRHAAGRHAQLMARVEAIKGVRTGGLRLGLWSDPARRFETFAGTLVNDLEESYFRLIKTNIQLLSLKEVGRSIIASLDRQRTVDSVLEYLHRGVGFNEFGLFTWRAEDGVFEGGVRRKSTAGFEWVPARFALPEADGVLARALGLQRSYLIKDAEAHALGTLHGEALFPDAAFESYVVVPLLQNPPPHPVWERRGCPPEGCPACPETHLRSWVDKFENEPDPDFWEGGRFRCWNCAAFPLLGCILVADTGRDLPLSKIDLIMLETLAQNLSTVLENSRLYDDLKREERFREHVIHSMSDGLVSVDLQGNVQLFNQAAERLCGFREAEVRGRSSGDLLFVGRDERDPLLEALRSGRSHRGLEATLRTASGKLLPVRLTTSPLRDEQGAVYGAIGGFADQSAIKGMEAQIRHLDKLAALGRFTSSVAHEIRNPLAGITAGIQYLRNRMDGPAQEHVDFILAEVDRMNRIIEDLFRVGRPLDLAFQEADLEALVERSVRTLEPRFEERGVRCLRRPADELPHVAVDADRIEQVLINLIQNAVEASPEGGTVEIELRLGSAQEPLDPAAEPDSVVIGVADQGEGISEENRDKIFEPFFTTKARGTGLGLYVCHHIIEGHGGSIVVDSSVGRGTRFLLCLPLGRIQMGGPSETADLARR